MVRRLLLTCAVLLMSTLASTTFFVVSTAIVTLVIEQESKAYTNRFLSAFTTVCCWQILLYILFLLLLDAEFVTDGQAVVCSAILMSTNLLLMATVFVKTKMHETHHVRHLQRVTLKKGRAAERKSDVLNIELVEAAQTHLATPRGNGDGAIVMVENPLKPAKA